MPRSPRPQFHVGYRSSRTPSKSVRRTKTPWIVSSAVLTLLLVGGAVVAWMVVGSDEPKPTAPTPTARMYTPGPVNVSPLSIDDVLSSGSTANAESDLKQFVLEGR